MSGQKVAKCVFHGDFKLVSRVSRVCVKDVPRDVSRVFQGNFEGVMRVFQGCWTREQRKAKP